jgi:hydroxyethylthiazole kinase-like uncharacterized protein yjeF
MSAQPHDTALFTAAQVRQIDRHVIDALGVPGFELMQRAAGAAFASLTRHWPDARRLCVLCGPGNNGGDGYLLAAQAREAGYKVELLALAGPAGDDAIAARAAFIAAGGEVHRIDEDTLLPPADVYVDALYGTGLNRAPGETASRLIRELNDLRAPVLALDIPSGLSADTGACPGEAVRASVTVSFIAWKRGLFTFGAEVAGERELRTLGLPPTAWEFMPPDAVLLQPDALPRRARDENKGSNGHVLAIGGDHGTGGAIRMAGEAALRTGAGLVSVATRPEHVSAMNAARPELMAHGVDDVAELAPMLARASVLAVGPGLGQGDWARALWHAALDSGKPLVLDADGLNLLAIMPRRFDGKAVLTPHPGEAGRLLGVSTGEIQKDRFAAARAMATRFDAVVVLKGSGSLIAAPDGRVAVCPWGNPGMASGGMGDILTGVIAALLAQGCDAWRAACLGVGLHARAGDIAAEDGERGLLASDLFAPIRILLNRSVHD